MAREASARRRWFLVLAPVVLVMGCAVRGRFAPAVAPSAGSAVLVARGSALEDRGVRAHFARALERATGLHVVLADDAAGPPDAEGAALAAQLARTYPALRGYDWREPRCPVAADLRLALAARAEVVYRATLAHVVRTAAEADAGSRPTLVRRFLGPIGLAPAGAVREGTLAGEVLVTAFTADARSERVAVEERVETQRRIFTRGPDLRRALEATAERLPATVSPHWSALARKLTKQGCPLLALAVYETHLASEDAHRDVRARALAVVARRREEHALQRDARRRWAEFERVLRAGDLQQAAALTTRYGAEVALDPATLTRMQAALAEAREAAAARASARDERYTCTALCSLHMVELCNNDKMLWSTHLGRFETTPCGARRSEPFLRDCYRQQWLSGTYQDACVRPCEESDAGRQRLKGILQSAGCLHLGPS